MKRINHGAALLAGALLSTAALVVTAGPASATPADCGSWPSPANATSVSTVYSQSIGRADTYAQLRVGYINGEQAGWARITGATKKGDLTWMDVSTDGGAHWVQCGPFAVDADGGTPYTKAYYTSSSTSLRFRACGRAFPAFSVCGSWW